MSIQVQEENAVTKRVITEAQLGNHIRFQLPEFVYVIYIYDEENDINLVTIDSVWTDSNDALKRMQRLEQMENALLKRSESIKYSYTYKLRGYSEKFPYPDGCSIFRENPDGTVYDYKYGIFCERASLNRESFLQPFDIEKVRALFKKVGKQL